VSAPPLFNHDGPDRGARTMADGLAALNTRMSTGRRRRGPYRTGFQPLDGVLGGGLEPGGLTVLGGAPGRGKTVAALQWARQAAIDGAQSIYVCFEHLERTLLARLLAAEVGQIIDDRGPFDAVRSEDIRARLKALANGECSVVDLASTDTLLSEAVELTFAYSDRMLLMSESGRSAALEPFIDLIAEHGRDRTVLFVDYLQKIGTHTSDLPDEDQVRRAAESLKDLAIETGIAVVAVAAADRAGLTSRRLTMEHLRGSSSTTYEADAVVVLNEKLTTVSRSHLAFDTTRHEDFRQHTIFSVEKNRSGQAGLDLEFQKDFSFFRFRPNGRFVSERLWREGGIEE
jgi:replicative DNA helicase